jgi:hypothetical protein
MLFLTFPFFPMLIYSKQVPPQYQPIITETNSLIERDIDELFEGMAADFKVKCKGIYKNRLAEMTAKMIGLSHQSTCSTCNAAAKASTSAAVPPSIAKVSDGAVGQGGSNLAQTVMDDADLDITEKLSSMVMDTVTSGARFQSSNARSSPLSRRNSAPPSYYDDIPSFNLLKEDDPNFKILYGDDMVGTKTGQAATPKPIPGSFVAFLHFLICILSVLLCDYVLT